MLEYYYDELSGEGIERRPEENSNTLQYPIYEDFSETLKLLQELGIEAKAFDPADYTAVYGIYDHYDLWYSPSTFRLYPALAYYWIESEQQLYNETAEGTVFTQSGSSSLLTAGSFTPEEIRMLYDLSQPLWGKPEPGDAAALRHRADKAERTQPSDAGALYPEDTLISPGPGAAEAP